MSKIANFRTGQVNFNRLYANLRREEQIVNNINKLRQERGKLQLLQAGRIGVHPVGSNARYRNTAINTRLNRSINRTIQEIFRLQAELVALRRRLLGPGMGTTLTNANILNGVNFAVRKAEINRMRGKRLARLITNAYLRPGGKFSRALIANVARTARARGVRAKSASPRRTRTPKRPHSV